MGYECPVCATPQADARHLANHLAFTAVLGDGEHEAWLDEHAPGWADAGEAELAPRVAEHAPEGEFPQVFEDTAGSLEEEPPTDPPEERSGALFDDEGDHDPGRGHAHAHGREQDHGDRTGHLASPGGDPEELDEEAREVLAEAREMTREMLADEPSEDEPSDADGAARKAGDGDGGDDGEERDG